MLEQFDVRTRNDHPFSCVETDFENTGFRSGTEHLRFRRESAHGAQHTKIGIADDPDRSARSQKAGQIARSTICVGSAEY